MFDDKKVFYKAHCSQYFTKATVFSFKFLLEAFFYGNIVLWKDLRLQPQEFDIFGYVCFNRLFFSHQFSLFPGIAT